MTNPAREVLTVIWQGEEIPGLTFYGLRRPGDERRPEFPTEAWAGCAEPRSSRLFGDRWEVLVWDVKLRCWPAPEEFPELVRRTLEALRVAGCKVAWVGREGYFADPPDLFLPDSMSEGVLAALSDETGFQMAVALDQPLRSLPDDELLALRKASDGLASSA
jgi:hypothetical protein